MKAVILAGGRGSRLDKFTENRNKSMIELLEKPLIEYNLNHAAKVNVSEIILIVCYKKEEIMERYGKEYKGIPIKYVLGAKNADELKTKGIVDALDAARKEINKSDFILMLADEILLEPNLKGMVKLFRKRDLFGVCGIVVEEDMQSISKTYTAMTNEKGRVFRLIEKPKVKLNSFKGTGHCILKNEILEYIDRTPINTIRGQKELVDLIQVAVDDNKEVHIFPIAKGYTNINTKEDYFFAKQMIQKSNPHVLIVHNQMKYYGGAELLITEFCNWLTRKGIRNDILTLSKSDEAERQLMNTEIIIPKNNLEINPPGYKNIHDIFQAIKIFRKKLKIMEKDYDVINFHDFPVTWCLWPRKKAAVWFMNLPPNLYSKPNAGFFYKTLNKFRILVDRFVIRKSIDVITVAEKANLIRAKQRYGRNAKFLNIGVNYSFFSEGNPTKMIQKYNLKNKFVIIQSGQICDVKNQLESLRTLNKIKDKIPNALLILTGKEDPTYKVKLDKYIRENKLEKHVLFIDMFKSRQELVDLYHAADVGLFPIGEQGGILAPLETLCAGVEVIVSKELETASMMQENKLGIVTNNYANAVLEVYKNKNEHKESAKKSARYIRDNLSWKAFSERMIEALEFAWKKYKKDAPQGLKQMFS